MKYRLTIYNFDSGLNELLNGMQYDFRTKRVFNRVKDKNDKICIVGIRKSDLFNVKIVKPIIVHYLFICKDKRRDRGNVSSAFEKSFLDALQKLKIIVNDGWDNVLTPTFDYQVDKQNPRVVVEIEEIENGETKTNYQW
jgi:Holliday junction resolvase RusA-like endonuclease